MPVFQIDLVIYQNGEPSSLGIDLNPSLYSFMPNFPIPPGELVFCNGELFYVFTKDGNESVLFVKDITPMNNIVQFETVNSLVTV